MYRRHYGLFHEALAFGEKEAFGLAVFLMFEFGESFEGSFRVGHTSEGSSMSSSSLGPPTIRMSPSLSGASGRGRAPTLPLPLTANTVRFFLRWRWSFERELP